MRRPGFPHWLVRFAVAVALPTVACFGYYSVDDLGGRGGVWVAVVVLAYPAALMGAIGLVEALLSPRRSRTRLWLWALCTVVPLAFLLVVRAGALR